MPVIRLKSVIKDLNISLNRAVEFLAEKGVSIDENPNAKIDDQTYNVLVKEFQSDKAQKEASSEVVLSKIPEPVARKEEPKPVTPPKPVEAEKPVEKKEEKPAEKPKVEQPKVEAPKVEVPKVEEKKEEAPKVAVEKPKVEAKKEEETVVEKPVSEEKLSHISTDKQEFKVLGKIELPSKKNKKTEKAVEKKAETEAPKATEKTPAPKSTPKLDASKSNAENTEEAPPEHLSTKFKKLEGIKVAGEKVDLKQFEKKKPVHNPNDPKKKRKRISKDVNVKSDGNRPNFNNNRPGGGGNNYNNRGGNNFRKPTPVVELTEEEVQKQVKETLEKLTNKGNKGKGAKYRRDKRNSRRESEAEQQERNDLDRTIKVTEFITVTELAHLMEVSATEVISSCFSLGVMVTMNQRLDAEILTLVTDEFGFSVEFTDAELEENVEIIEDKEEDLVFRAPVVTIMGHVDHGKTSLLDYVRETNVIAGESGGITQHIGAYRVELEDGNKISFLDTPGHEAFTAMRARGAQVTDIAIIVIAADDDVMPQTKEAISHAQAAGVPMIIALNKIDREAANPDKIKEQLSAMNVLVEDWGGKVQCQEISAKFGTNVDKLLEKVLLEAEMLDLKANPNRRSNGVVIEATLEKGRGYTTTLLVQNGTLKVGDFVLAGKNYGKVKALLDERGHEMEEAGPSMPATILGLDGAPTAGDKFSVFEDEREAKSIASKREQLSREQSVRTKKTLTLDEIGRRIALGDFKELNIILKGDVDGSVEALTDSLQKLSNEEIEVKILHRGVGQITETDVQLAAASDAIIIGFNVRPGVSAKQIADKEEVEIRTYSIIYDAINEIKEAMEGLLSPEIKEEVLGNVEIREIFKISKIGTIAGCMVTDGKITRNAKIRIIREGIVAHDGELDSLKRFKDDVKEVTKGYECGLNLKNYNDIQVGDNLEVYHEVQVKKKLK